MDGGGWSNPFHNGFAMPAHASSGGGSGSVFVLSLTVDVAVRLLPIGGRADDAARATIFSVQ